MSSNKDQVADRSSRNASLGVAVMAGDVEELQLLLQLIRQFILGRIERNGSELSSVFTRVRNGTGIHHTWYYRTGSGMGAPGAIPVRFRYRRGRNRGKPVSEL